MDIEKKMEMQKEVIRDLTQEIRKLKIKGGGVRSNRSGRWQSQKA